MQNNKHNWQVPEKIPELDNAGIHVWKASVKDFTAKQFWPILSNPEKIRANRFVFPEHQDRFIIVHGILRNLLADYLHAKPEDLSFKTNKFGKPKINNINFNISHSRDLALFAISNNYDVGVDIEFINKDIDLDIAERFFSAHEAQALLKLPITQQPKAFFNCWTRKEAFIKAIGTGLSFPLHKFDVDISYNKDSLLLNIRDAKYKPSDWKIFNLNVAKDYAAALCQKPKNPGSDALHLQETFYFRKFYAKMLKC